MPVSEDRSFKPMESRCGQAEALWIVVLLLLLGVGSAITTASVLGLLQIPRGVTLAVLFAAVYCALALAALLVAGIALSISRACIGDRMRTSCGEKPGSTPDGKEGVPC